MDRAEPEQRDHAADHHQDAAVEAADPDLLEQHRGRVGRGSSPATASARTTTVERLRAGIAAQRCDHRHQHGERHDLLDRMLEQVDHRGAERSRIPG